MVQALSIRTKLIMAMLALVASVALMGMTADDANAAGVTEIRWVENHTPYGVYFWNHETGVRKSIAPYTAVSVNSRVPWATNKYEFGEGKYIELGFTFPTDLRRIAIWQEAHNRPPWPGDKIRYYRSLGTNTGLFYNSSAPPMPGASNTGGRRNLIIRYTQKSTGYPVMHAGLCC